MSDATVNVQEPGTPTKRMDSEQVGTSGGLPLVRERVMAYPVSGALLAGTTALTGTTAAPLAADTACTSVAVQNPADNAEHVLVGDSSSQVLDLAPGDAVSLDVGNLDQVYVANAASASQSVVWLAEV